MTTDEETTGRIDSLDERVSALEAAATEPSELEERVSALEKAPTVNSATSVLPVDAEPVDAAGNPTI